MNHSIKRRTSRKPDLIIAAAEKLYQKYGFRRVSIEEICRKASVSKMTFYKYFMNKDELFKRMVTKWYDESVVTMDAIKAMDRPFTEKIRMIMHLKEEYLAKLSEEFLEDYIHPAPPLRAFMEEFYAKGIALFIDFIRDAQAKGEVRREIRPEFLIAVLNKIIELAKDTDLMSLYPNALDFTHEINNFIFSGILPIGKAGHGHA